MGKNAQPTLEATAPQDLGQQEQDFDWEHLTGRDRYFKPESNVDHDIVAINWKNITQPGKKAGENKDGIQVQIIKLDGQEIKGVEKLWTITSVRLIRELEPILIATVKKKQAFLHIEVRKSLARDRPATEAVFTIKNLNEAIADLIPSDDDDD